jgi:endonuclease-3
VAEDGKRVRAVLRVLHKQYPDAECALRFDNPLQLLVATILSAQCTDQRVNMVTPGLFEKWGTAEDLAEVPSPLLEEEIRSTGFFRNKARNIQGAARAILERHGGEVPRSMEELVALPGVARKTANVVLGTAFGVAEGIVVDTHVGRVAGRLGLAGGGNPVAIERELMEIVPRRDWIWFAHALIRHGRGVCRSRNPDCRGCALRRHCPSRSE